jgi:outer membrane protein TolC
MLKKLLIKKSILEIFFALIFFSPIIISAQTTPLITYQQAVELALKNNYDVQIAKNNTSITEVQNTYGNAGFLPRVDLQANRNLSNNNTLQEFSNGLSVNKNGVASNNTIAGVYLNWTIFDGMRMFATKERLNIIQQQGQISFKIQVENTLEEVTLLYYQIVKQLQLIKGIQTAINVSEERIKIAEKKVELGLGSNVELLQAKLDRNAQKSNMITQKNILTDYKNEILIATKSDPNSTFTVDTFFIFNELKSIEEIKQSMEKSNNALQFAQKDVQITAQSIKEIRSQMLPTLGFNTQYQFGRVENAAGFALLNQNVGFNAGLTFSWNLFNGFITQNQIKVAQLQLSNSSLNVDKTKLSITSQANSAYTRYLGDKELLALEEENIKLADESLLIALERLKLGLGNYLETKESQNSYEQAVTRLVNARYSVKQSETRLRKLTGELFK